MTRRKTLPLLLLSLALGGSALHGQPMSLSDCMDYAVSHSTEMRLSAADRSDERAEKVQALLNAFTPSVSAQSYAYNQYGRNLDPETNTYTDFTTFHNGYSLSAGITLFDGFQAINRLRIAKVQQQMGLSQERQTADKVRLATMEAYYQVVYYDRLVEVLRLQAATADSALLKAQREEALGRKGHADVVQMESEQAQRQFQLTQAEGQLQQALLTLKETMCWPLDSSLSITKTITKNENNNGNDNGNAFVLPSVQIAGAQLCQAQLQLQQARGAWSPSLSLNAGWSTTYYTYPDMAGYQPLPFREQWKNNGGEYVQLTLSIPIYSKGQRSLALNKSKNEVSRAQARLEQAQQERDNALCRARDEVATAQAAARQATRMAEVKRQAFLLAQRQYALGLITAIEYQTASQSFLTAEADNINALLQLQLKRHQLNYYRTGKLL
ncbi:MAG: TolC family protein [Bacteroidales bacterium]|nr:TolC family protein [Bacteroidales bacterium]